MQDQNVRQVDAPRSLSMRPFARAHTLAIVAVVFLGISMIASVLTVTVIDDFFFVTFPPVTVGGSVVAGVVGAACVVTFLIWLNRARRNLEQLGATELDHSPGAAIGWWFVPVVNFWKPLEVMIEIWKASDPAQLTSNRETRRRLPMPALAAIWWALWLTALLLDNVIAAPDRIASRGATNTTAILVATAYDMVAAAFAIAVVLEIDRRQLQKARMLAG